MAEIIKIPNKPGWWWVCEGDSSENPRPVYVFESGGLTEEVKLKFMSSWGLRFKIEVFVKDYNDWRGKCLMEEG